MYTSGFRSWTHQLQQRFCIKNNFQIFICLCVYLNPINEGEFITEIAANKSCILRQMLQIVWRDMCRFIQPYVIITIEMRHRNKLVSQFYIKLRNQNTDSSSVVSLFLFNNLCNLKDVIFFTF